MRRRVAILGLGSCLLFGCSAVPALAQGEPPVGVRAAGMGGAFTAVADDASATVWNPAGLASGSYFSAAVDRSGVTDGGSSLFAGFALPVLGISYQRVAGAFPTGSAVTGRNTLVAQSAGVSLVQSIGDTGVAVGTTLKLVHGETSIDQARKTGNAFDADVGVMLSGGLGQLGLVVHNLRRPAFDSTDGEVRLNRRVRGGAAVHVSQETTIAADVEFTKAAFATKNGDSPLFWRDAAIGVENAPIPSVRVRAGVHWNTARGGAIGAAPTASVGGSYAIRGSLMADGQVSFGSKDGPRGWGAGLRVLF